MEKQSLVAVVTDALLEAKELWSTAQELPADVGTLEDFQAKHVARVLPPFYSKEAQDEITSRLHVG